MISALPLSLASPSGLVISERDRAFVVSFGEVVRACSWAIAHGGIVDAEHVAWLEVTNAELGPTVDARAWLAERLRRERLARAVGLLTSRRLTSRRDANVTVDGVTAFSIATVGLGNALRAGDSPATLPTAGTINVLVHVSQPLTDEGLLEASAIATEAKSAALFDARIPSRRATGLATGTGTDCTVVTCPRAGFGRPAMAYAGKHTAIGAAIGGAVGRALAEGISAWLVDIGA